MRSMLTHGTMSAFVGIEESCRLHSASEHAHVVEFEVQRSEKRQLGHQMKFIARFPIGARLESGSVGAVLHRAGRIGED